MTIICTSTVRHGDTHLVVTGTGATREEALHAAVHLMDVGYQPNPVNVRGALELLSRYHNLGERPPGGPGGKYLDSVEGYAYLSLDDDGYPVIQIGWSDFTFSEPRTVKLWAISAQVEIRTVAGWDASRQVPTFYLDPTVQGITDAAGARRVAEDIIYTTAGDWAGVKLHVTAEPVY